MALCVIGDTMMDKKKVIVVGCGSRGKTYTDIMKSDFGDDFKVVMTAETIYKKSTLFRRICVSKAGSLYSSVKSLLILL